MRTAFFPLLAGCAAPAFAPDATVAGDPMVAALPADVTAVLSVDFAAVGASDAAARALRALGVDPAALDAALERAGSPRRADVDRVVAGCGEAGCVALVEGGFAELDPSRTLRAGPLLLRLASGDAPGLDATGPNGERYALRRLSAEKVAFGDRAAVRAARDARGRGLDGGLLAGDVPEGAAWLAVRDVDRLLEQAEHRAARSGIDLAAPLEAALARSPVPLGSVRAAALALALDEPPEARLRVRCDSAETAAALAATVEGAAARDGLAVTVARAGVRVEATVPLDEAGLAALGAAR